MSDLPKTFEPGPIETRWYGHWEESGSFRPARPDAEPFTIVMPPPNVTGSLHIGHALDNTLQDILTRIARLQGKDALWVKVVSSGEGALLAGPGAGGTSVQVSRAS